MNKLEIYPSTINEVDKLPFFHNIKLSILNIVSKKNNYQSPLFLYSVLNAYVSPYGTVFKNGKVISESVYKSTFKKNWTNLFSFLKKILQNKIKNIEGDCIVISHSWYDNYYHWMVEIVPRLFLMKSELSDKKLIIHKKLSKFHLDVLGNFEFKEIVFIEVNELAKCKKVFFTSFPNYYTNYEFSIESRHINIIESNMNYSLMREMKQWFENNNLPPNNKTENIKTRIYISRKKASKRKISNEIELEKMLHENGFVTVFLEEISFSEQMKLFMNLDIVLGCHGAGFANLLFMKKNSHVIDLISEHLNEFCYYTMANIVNVNYSHVGCSCPGPVLPNPGNNDIEADLNKIKDILHSIIQTK